MQTRRVIGGEFELSEFKLGSPDMLSRLTRGLSGTWTLSGRSALSLILRTLQGEGIRHIHLPTYLCESLIQPVKALGLRYSFYPVEADLRAKPDPPSGAAVLIIHYFGWPNSAASDLRAEAGRSFQLIEDACQALLSDWSASVSVPRFIFLSPRKFGPTLLGGWCNVSVNLAEAPRDTTALVQRSLAARIARGAYLAEPDAPVNVSVERGYLEVFEAQERFLDDHPTYASVPQLVLDVAAGLDWGAIAARRRQNWQILSDCLRGYVEPVIPVLPPSVVPLGYVVRLKERDRVRARLAERRIFCPVHWPIPSVCRGYASREAIALAESCLTLPVDQRYGTEDMLYVADTLKALM